MTGATADRATSAPTDERVLADVLARLEARTDELVDEAATAIFAEIPAYQSQDVGW